MKRTWIRSDRNHLLDCRYGHSDENIYRRDEFFRFASNCVEYELERPHAGTSIDNQPMSGSFFTYRRIFWLIELLDISTATKLFLLERNNIKDNEYQEKTKKLVNIVWLQESSPWLSLHCFGIVHCSSNKQKWDVLSRPYSDAWEGKQRNDDQYSCDYLWISSSSISLIAFDFNRINQWHRTWSSSTKPICQFWYYYINHVWHYVIESSLELMPVFFFTKTWFGTCMMRIG